MVYDYLTIQKVPKLPEIPRVELPQIPEIKDLEKIVGLMDGAYSEFHHLANLARESIQEYLDLKETPRPFFWQINKLEQLKAKSERSYESAKILTESLKGMGILKEDIGVINPAYSLGLMADYKRKLLEKVLEVHYRALQQYAEYHNKIVREMAEYNKKSNESMAEIYKGIGSSYRAFNKKPKKSKLDNNHKREINRLE